MFLNVKYRIQDSYNQDFLSNTNVTIGVSRLSHV